MLVNIERIKRFLSDPLYRVNVLRHEHVFDWMPDKYYLGFVYKTYFSEKLNWNDLRTYNQKIQWLKLYDRKPEYSRMVDKVSAKEYVVECIGDQLKIIPTLAVWSRFEDIDFSTLPNQFVLKCTHDSGSVVICTDKSNFDIDAAKNKLKRVLKKNYYWFGREWPYKSLTPRIMAEEYMNDSEADLGNLTDYKIFCFHGKPQYIMTVRDRSKGKGKSLHRWYDLNWELQDLDLDYRDEIKVPEERPQQLDKMLEIAEKLSAGMKHLRVDLYVINGEIYFGELTFYHMSGCERFEPKEWDLKLGELLHLE